MTEQEQNVARRWFDEIWNQGRRETIAELLAPDGVIHDSGTTCVGPEGFYAFFDRLHGAFSEFNLTIEDYIVAGDRVCVRWSSSCKHTGDALGIPATNKLIHVTGISIARIANNQLVEGWQNWDMLGMMEQIQGTRASTAYIGQHAANA